MSPGRGSGLSQVFSFTLNDNVGWQDLGIINVLINSSLNGNQSCYLAYSNPLTTLYLMSDSGGGLLPGMPLNGSGFISNSQCAIDGAGSSVTSSGSSLTLNLSVSFSSSYLGDAIVYVAARDAAGHNSGWQPMGTWSVR